VSGAAEDAIREIIAQQVSAWNRGDAEGYGAASRAELGFTNILGMRWDTREAFITRHAEMFAGPFSGSTLAVTIERLGAPSTDVILAELRTTLTGFRGLPPGITAVAGVLTTRMLQVFVRERDGWYIAAFHNTAVLPAPRSPQT
jgi:uncharacterized protein (TIGR02246 family)